jgi:hypothetical protein
VSAIQALHIKNAPVAVQAIESYRQMAFKPKGVASSPSDPMMLMIGLKDLSNALSA